jgi:hypothetical protein
VHRDQIAEMTTTIVRCNLSEEQVLSLPEPHGTRVLHADLDRNRGKKPSFFARIGNMFGSKRDQDPDLI